MRVQARFYSHNFNEFVDRFNCLFFAPMAMIIQLAWISVLIALAIMWYLASGVTLANWIEFISRNEMYITRASSPKQTKNIQHFLAFGFGHATDVDNYLRITYNNEIFFLFFSPFVGAGARTHIRKPKWKEIFITIKYAISFHFIASYETILCIWITYLVRCLVSWSGTQQQQPAAAPGTRRTHTQTNDDNDMWMRLCLRPNRRVCSVRLFGWVGGWWASARASAIRSEHTIHFRFSV